MIARADGRLTAAKQPDQPRAGKVAHLAPLQPTAAHIDDPRARSDALAVVLARAVAARNAPAVSPVQPTPRAGATLARAPTSCVSDDYRFAFTLDPYEVDSKSVGNAAKHKVGCEIGITFHPPPGTPSEKIAFVQVMKTTKETEGTMAPFFLGKGKHRRTHTRHGEAGWKVDRRKGKKWGYYGMTDKGRGSGQHFRFGTRHLPGIEGTSTASMHDHVKLGRAPQQRIKVDAVTYALDITNAVYLGGVSWGMQTHRSGRTHVLKPELKKGAPTGVQAAAIKRWNRQASLDDVKKRNAPDQQLLIVPP